MVSKWIVSGPPALQIPEIRHEIFEQLLKPRRGSQPYLLSAALTCRTFHDTAIPIMWRHVSHFEILLCVWRARLVLTKNRKHEYVRERLLTANDLPADSALSRLFKCRKPLTSTGSANTRP